MKKFLSALLLAALTYTAHAQSLDDEKSRQDWANIKRYQEANAKLPAPTKGSKRVVYMGDSITDFWIMNDSAFFSQNNYVDRGISGQTTGQMLVRFREDVINLKPAAVVILAGINDIAENNGRSKMEDVFGNIVSMAELARVHNIKVVLSSVLPANYFPWRQMIKPAPEVVKLNTMLKTYAAKNNIVYLDYHTAMKDDKDGLPKTLSGDGVHPNLAGYKLMEPLVQAAIKKALSGK